jgi:hypothetical protein
MRGCTPNFLGGGKIPRQKGCAQNLLNIREYLKMHIFFNSVSAARPMGNGEERLKTFCAGEP